MGATAPFWRFSAASYPDLKEQAPISVLRGSKKEAMVPQNETTAGVCASLLLSCFMKLTGTIDASIFFLPFMWWLPMSYWHCHREFFEACNSNSLFVFFCLSHTQDFPKFANRTAKKLTFLFKCREMFIPLSQLLTPWYIVFSTLTGDFSLTRM